jgi:4-hydroxy-tetrahydrodipicolinate synthase
MTTRFHGIVPAVATPFTRDYRLDEGRLRDLIEHYIASGVHGISVAGSQGEFFALQHDEHVRLNEVAARIVAGRVPLYAGTGATTTAQSIRLTEAAAASGADVAMAITPFFISPSADELVEHYRAISKASKLPLMLYNNPPRTGVNVLPRVFLRCAEDDNIIGIKDSSGDVTQLAEYVRLTGGKKVVFAGRDTIILSTIVHGGAGAISPAANVFPRLVVRLYETLKAGRLDEAQRISDILAPLRAAWEFGSFPVVIKEAMALVGLDAGPARPPIMPLSAEKRAQLKGVIDVIGAAEQRETGDRPRMQAAAAR